MTNENLKVEDVLVGLDNISVTGINHEQAVKNAINLIKSQQSRIDLLESAIREFTNFVDPRDMLDSHARALNKLLELMEQAK